MSRQLFVKTGIVFAILMTVAASASAEVITIVGGTFTYDGDVGGRLNVAGNRGFTIDAGTGFGIFNAFNQCHVSAPECPPGTVVEINARWSGSDLGGTAALRGKTYPDLGSFNSPNWADVRFSGRITMPPMSDGPVSVTVPFDFAGRFIYGPDFETGTQEALLTGGGLATFHFAPHPNFPSWYMRSAEFEFRPVKR
jgi:hypothetical protein